MRISPTMTPPMRAATPQNEAFDLGRIDTPVEALLMPMVDLAAGLAAGNGEAARAEVTLQAGDQSLTYTITQGAAGAGIAGSMNGEAFELEAAVDPSSMQVEITGQTPGGNFQETMEVEAGGFHLTGQVGDVPFEETFALNPFGGFSGEIGSVEGSIGGQELLQEFRMGEDGQSVEVTGHLGEREIHERISQGPNGTVLIEGTIGELSFTQTVRKG